MRRTLPLAILLVVACAAAPAADAATKNVIRGRGFGHGVGMSQYGAYGYAKHGSTYDQILAHYYTGTRLSKAPTEDIRVLLQQNASRVWFTGASQANGKKLNPRSRYYVRAAGLASYELRNSRGKRVAKFQNPVDVTSDQGIVRLLGRALNGVSSGHYRGTIEIQRATFGGLVAVNDLALDDYVKGVVPGEMPSSWLPEALKAQAVAARSYALTTDAGGSLFDQYPDTRSQVYRGADSEVPSTNAAVQATAGQVVTYKGKIATTYFFSTSGGHTEDVENVFYGASPTPYLVGVDDPYDKISPKHTWRVVTTARRIDSRLGSLVRGRYRGVKVVKRGVSPRIVQAYVLGSRGRTLVSGATLRSRLGLDDTWAYFARTTTKVKKPKPKPPVSTPGPQGNDNGGTTAVATFFSKLQRDLLRQPQLVYGSASPRPAKRLVTVERKTAKGWRKVRRLRTDKRGRYSLKVMKRGLYRVRANGFAGPAVRVR